MPEGDTLHRLAAALRPALVGHVVQRLWLRDRGELAQLAGRRVERVEALGTHLLVGLDDGWTLRVHLGMKGRWTRRATGAAVPSSATVVLDTGEARHLCSRGAQAEARRSPAGSADPRLAALGPPVGLPARAPRLPPLRHGHRVDAHRRAGAQRLLVSALPARAGCAPLEPGVDQSRTLTPSQRSASFAQAAPPRPRST